jgi:N-acetylmuramoyl-L-alanine amidase
MVMNPHRILLCMLMIAYPVTHIQAGKFDTPLKAPAPQNRYKPRYDIQTEQSLSPHILVLHYTELSLGLTLKTFLKEDPQYQAASHYTISDEGVIFEHVAEDMAAHHAGVSYWRGLTELNKYSIGIEHVNLGYRHNEKEPEGNIVEGSDREWYPFSPRQIEASIAFCQHIVDKYTIDPRNVVGHSDIAPQRKTDPGPLFPWQQFAERGVGAWPDPEQSACLACFPTEKKATIVEFWIIKHLQIWGYKPPNEVTKNRDLIQSFQMHFRPTNISGKADMETATILKALLCKYVIKEDKPCPCS